MEKKTKQKIRKIEVIFRTPFSDKEIGTAVVITDCDSIVPELIERVLEEQFRRVIETIILNGCYSLSNK